MKGQEKEVYGKRAIQNYNKTRTSKKKYRKTHTNNEATETEKTNTNATEQDKTLRQIRTRPRI